MKKVKGLFFAGTVLVLVASVSSQLMSAPDATLAGKNRVYRPCTMPDGSPGTYGTCVLGLSNCSTLTECMPTSDGVSSEEE